MFSPRQPRMTLARTIKLYKLPSTPATPGLRPMRASDAPAVAQLLNSYLAHYKLSQHFSADEVEHWCESLRAEVGRLALVAIC